MRSASGDAVKFRSGGESENGDCSGLPDIAHDANVRDTDAAVGVLVRERKDDVGVAVQRQPRVSFELGGDELLDDEGDDADGAGDYGAGGDDDAAADDAGVDDCAGGIAYLSPDPAQRALLLETMRSGPRALQMRDVVGALCLDEDRERHKTGKGGGGSSRRRPRAEHKAVPGS